MRTSRTRLGRPAVTSAVVAAAAIAAALVATATSDAAPQAAPIKVGLLASFTGPGGVFGPATKDAALLAVQQINAHGGVLGRKLGLDIADDATDPKVGNSAMNRLVNKDRVDVVFGMHSSATRDAVKQIPQRANKLYIYTPVYEGTDCGKNMYFLGEVPNQQVGLQVPYMDKLVKAKRWYLIGNDYVWPHTEIAYAKQIIAGAGGKVVGTNFVPLGTSDFSTAINKISRAKPDIVFAPLVGGDAIAFEKQAHDFGLKVKYLTPLMEENTLLGIGPQASSGIYTAMSYFWNLNTPNNKRFRAQVLAKFGKKAPPQNSLSESVYEGLQLWARAAAKAKSLDTDSVVKALAGMTYNGPRGLVKLDGTTRHLTQHVYLAQSQPNAQYKVVHDFGLVTPKVSCHT